MLQKVKFWDKLAFLAALISIIIYILILNETKEEAWRHVKSNLIAENAELNHENELL